MSGRTPGLDTPTADASSARYIRCAAGDTIADPRPGDVILIRGAGWLGRLIRLFERMRYRTDEDRAYANWSHAAIVVGRDGLLVEVLHTGVTFSRLEKYRDQDYRYIRLDLSDSDRKSAASYACACLRQKYGVSSFFYLRRVFSQGTVGGFAIVGSRAASRSSSALCSARA